MQNANACSKPKAQSGIRHLGVCTWECERTKNLRSSNFLALLAKCTCSLGWWAQKQTPHPTHICMSGPCNSFLRCNLLHGSAVANSKYLVDRMVAYVTPLASSLCLKPVKCVRSSIWCHGLGATCVECLQVVKTKYLPGTFLMCSIGQVKVLQTRMPPCGSHGIEVDG